MEFKVFTEIRDIFPWFTGEIPDTKKKIQLVLIPIHVSLENLYRGELKQSIKSTLEFCNALTIDNEIINNLRTDPSFFLILNNTHEGYSQKKFNIFDHIVNLGLEYDIPDNKILYFTSNILEEEEYKKLKTKYKFKVFSFNVFEHHRYTGLELGSFDDTVYRIRSLDEEHLKNWLCLNRVRRSLRNSACYMIWKSQLYKDCLISYDSFTVKDIKESFFDCFDIELVEEEVNEFIRTSPKILDRKDFEVNWAMEKMPLDLYNSTCLSIVNETVEAIKNCDYFKKNMLFYSEKTFKVIEFGQPFVIIGPAGLNTNLEKIGYKPYSSYFNLDFDIIEDHYARLTTQIKMLEDLNENLNIMTHKEKICWLLKDVETIHYNKVKKYRNNYTKKTISRVIDFFHRL